MAELSVSLTNIYLLQEDSPTSTAWPHVYQCTHFCLQLCLLSSSLRAGISFPLFFNLYRIKFTSEGTVIAPSVKWPGGKKVASICSASAGFLLPMRTSHSRLLPVICGGCLASSSTEGCGSLFCGLSSPAAGSTRSSFHWNLGAQPG